MYNYVALLPDSQVREGIEPLPGVVSTLEAIAARRRRDPGLLQVRGSCEVRRLELGDSKLPFKGSIYLGGAGHGKRRRNSEEEDARRWAIADGRVYGPRGRADLGGRKRRLVPR